METLWQDLRYGARTLFKKPGFTLVVMLTLALGIGANTAIFSLIYGILLRPFPYQEPERLVRVQSVYAETTGNLREVSPPDVVDWQAQARGFAGFGAYFLRNTQLTGDGPALAVQMALVTPDVFPVLGVSPVIGRNFLPDEDRYGGDIFKAILSHGLWQSKFGGEANVLGRTITLRGAPYTVVGVMPPGFRFPDKSDVWVPVQTGYSLSYGDAVNQRALDRGSRFQSVVARLKPGVSLEQARAEMNGIAANLQRQYADTNKGVQYRLTPLREAETGNVRPFLLLLLGAVALVLLICCVNVANLLLARASSRERELAIRAALGSTRGRLARQLLTESLLLGLIGGASGVALAWLGVKALLRLIPVQLPFWMKIEVDAAALLFSLAVAVLTSVLFGLVPAWRMSRADLSLTLKEGAKGSAGGGRRLRDGLVIVEVALSLVLLVGAGLMMQSFVRLQQVDAGIEREHLLTATVSPYKPRDQRDKIYPQYYRQVMDKLVALPGVAAVGGGNDFPYIDKSDERKMDEIAIRGQSAQEARQLAPVEGADVAPGYFAALGVPLLEGRDFTEADDLTKPKVVVISAHTAKTLWPGQPAIGQQIRWGAASATNDWNTVIGVVGDTKWQAAEQRPGFEIYYSYRQFPPSPFHFLIRARGEPESLIASVRQAIQAVDPDTAVVQVKAMEQIVTEALWQRRLWGVLFAVFAGLALMLAAVGIYGVLSYLVSQRTRELGIRMALGATTSNVLRLVMGQGLKLALIGVVCGLAVALLFTRLMTTLLFGVSANDPLTFVGVALLLMLVALIACFVPARRAAKVDPMIALRTE